MRHWKSFHQSIQLPVCAPDCLFAEEPKPFQELPKNRPTFVVSACFWVRNYRKSLDCPHGRPASGRGRWSGRGCCGRLGRFGMSGRGPGVGIPAVGFSAGRTVVLLAFSVAILGYIPTVTLESEKCIGYKPFRLSLTDGAGACRLAVFDMFAPLFKDLLTFFTPIFVNWHTLPPIQKICGARLDHSPFGRRRE